MRFQAALFLAVLWCSPALAQSGDGSSRAPLNWENASASITAVLETGRSQQPADYATVTGDFDQQGISVGRLQWNFGQGSIGELLDKVDRLDAVLQETMPVYGQTFNAMTQAGLEGLAWSRSVQAGGEVRPDVKREIQAFLAHPNVVTAQDEVAGRISDQAWTRAKRWAADTRTQSPVTFREYAFFYDLIVQGGALYLDELTSLNARFAGFQKDQVDTAFDARALQARRFYSFRINRSCEAGAAGRRPRGGGHEWDAAHNCLLWGQTANTGQADRLLVLAFQRALFNKPAWAINFFNRKGLLAQGVGYANGRRCDFNALYAKVEAGETVDSQAVMSACRGA